MFPSKRQFKRWSLTSKYSFAAFWVALFVSAITYFFPYSAWQASTPIATERTTPASVIGPEQPLGDTRVVIYAQPDVARQALDIERDLSDLGANVLQTRGGGLRPSDPIVYYTKTSDMEAAVRVSNTLKEYGFSDVNQGTFGREFDVEDQALIFIYVNKYTLGLDNEPQR